MGDNNTVTAVPPQLNDNLEPLVEPEEVFSICSVVMRSMNAVEVLIKWKGLLSFKSTLELYELLQRQFPNFHLKDKVTRWGGGY